MTEKLTLPLVHLNGTAIKTLMEDYDAADDALREFIKAWAKIEFNSRDYYPLGNHAWSEASDVRVEMNKKIREIKEYIDAHLAHLYDQKK